MVLGKWPNKIASAAYANSFCVFLWKRYFSGEKTSYFDSASLTPTSGFVTTRLLLASILPRQHIGLRSCTFVFTYRATNDGKICVFPTQEQLFIFNALSPAGFHSDERMLYCAAVIHSCCCLGLFSTDAASTFLVYPSIDTSTIAILTYGLAALNLKIRGVLPSGTSASQK